MKKFVLKDATPSLDSTGMTFFENSINPFTDYLSQAKENGQNFVCFNDSAVPPQWLTGLGCSACSEVNNPGQILGLQCSNIRDREKGNFIHSFTCSKTNPQGVSIECRFEGSSVSSERG